METKDVKYIKSVYERLEQYSTPAYKIKTLQDGTITKEFPPNYSEYDNLEKAKYEWFCKAVNFDKDICEAILHPKACSLRLEVQRMNLAQLMVKASEFNR